MNEADEVKHYSLFIICMYPKGLCVTASQLFWICGFINKYWMSCETRKLGVSFGFWALIWCSCHWSIAVLFYSTYIPKIWSRSSHLQTRIRSCTLLSPVVWTIVTHSAGTHHASIFCPGCCPSRYFYYGHLILAYCYYYEVGFILYLILHYKAFSLSFYSYYSYFYIILSLPVFMCSLHLFFLHKALSFFLMKHFELCFLCDFAERLWEDSSLRTSGHTLQAFPRL